MTEAAETKPERAKHTVVLRSTAAGGDCRNKVCRTWKVTKLH